MKSFHHARSMACLSLLALAANAPAEEWFKHFRVGMSFALNISTDFKTSGTFPVTGAAPGPATGNADRIYDDGYVRVDETGNLPINGAGPSVTTFWGYQNASQLSGGTLTYHASSRFTGSAEHEIQDAVHLGFDMGYGGTIAKWERVAIGAEFGFNLTTISTKDSQPIAANISQFVDTYSTGGTAIPGAPYSGPFTTPGPPNPAPIINSEPSAPRNAVILPGLITGERRLDAILYQIRLGPLIRWEIRPRWTLNGSLGGSLGLIDGAYKFNEQVGLGNGASSPNRGEFSSLETTYGGYAGAVLMFDSNNNWEAFLGTHFITMTDAEFAQAGRSAKVNLGGAVYISVGINWTF